MSMQLEYPSQTFPGWPELELRLPRGWEPVPTAGAVVGLVLAARRPEPSDEFQMNVIVTLSEVPRNHQLVHDIEGVDATAAQREQGVTGDPYLWDLSGVTFFGKDLSWIDPQAGTLLAINLFGFIRREDDTSITRIEVTGTMGASRETNQEYALLQSVIGGLKVTPSPGTFGYQVDDAQGGQS